MAQRFLEELGQFFCWSRSLAFGISWHQTFRWKNACQFGVHNLSNSVVLALGKLGHNYHSGGAQLQY